MKSLLKFFKIIAIILVCLILLGLIGGFIFLKTFDIKQYKTKIIAVADKALGRHVDFNDIQLRVSLKEGIRFHLTDLTVSENPNFAQGDFVKVKELFVGLDLLSFLNARQVFVPNILIKSPEITIIQNSAGALNVQSIGSASSQNNTPTQSSSSAPAALPAIFINSLRIEGARLTYINQTVNPSFESSVSQLDIKVDHFSLNKPFNFSVEGALLSPQRNLKIDGNADLNVLAKVVRLSSVHVALDLGQFPLADLRRLPLLKGVPIPEVLEGKYNGTIKECVLSDKGIGALTLDSQLDSGKVVIKDVAPGISVDISAINLNVTDFSFGKPFHFSIKAAYMGDEPNIDLKGNAIYDMASQGVRLDNVTFNTDLALWPLRKLKAEIAPLKDVRFPEKLTGKLQISVKELSEGPQGLGDFVLDAALKDGEISLKEIAPGISFDASKITFSVSDFSLNAPFKVALQMAYLNEMPDVDLQGTVGFDVKAQAVHLEDFKFNVDLGLLSLEQLKSSVSLVKGMPLPETLSGKLQTNVKKLDAGPQGLKSVLMDAHLSDGKIIMNNLSPGVSFVANQMDLEVRDFSLDSPFACKLKLAYLSDVPNINFDGSISYNMQTQGVQLKDSIVDIDLSHLNFAQLKSSVAALSTVGLPQTLSGDAKVTIKELSAGPKGLGSVNMDVDLNNGALSLKDIAPGISVDTSQIGLQLKNVSLGKEPISFRLNAAYLSDKPNVDLTGVALVDLAQSSVQLKDTLFKTDLSLLSMDQLRSSIGSLKNASLPQTLKGLLNVQIDEATAGSKGLVAFTSHGELTSGMVKLKELTVPIDISQVKFQADGTNAKFDDILVSIGKGKIKAKATIDQYLTKPIINKEITIEGLDLSEILEQKDAPVKIQGLLDASIKAQGDISNLKSIVGDGTFEIKDAKLKDLNVLKTVFDSIKIPLVPNLSSLVMGALPQEYRTQFEKPDTDFKSVKWTMNISNGLIHLDPIDVESDVFAFTGKGDVGFDQTYSVDGSFKISKDLSDLLVKDVQNPFAYLIDENNLISFPVHAKGKGAQTPSFAVDAVLKDVATNALRNKGKEELGKALEKVLGGQTENSSQTDNKTNDSSQSQSPERQLIDGIFGTIFKK